MNARNRAVLFATVFGATHGCAAAQHAGDAVLPENIPVDQRAAFVDGRVDMGEYRLAFHDFQACAEQAGGAVNGHVVDPISGLIGYSTEEPIGTDRRESPTDDCYRRHFGAIESSFTETNVAAQEFVVRTNLLELDRMMHCLEAHDIEVPNDVQPGTEAFGAIIATSADLRNAGLC